MTSHNTIIQYALWFLGLLLMQVLVFNHMHFLGYATPMPFIYMLLIMHNETPRWVYIILGFTLGLLIDIAANTIGECASVATLLGLITPHLLNAFSPSDRGDDGFFPSAITMKWGGFLSYVTAASFVLCSLFFIIENFSFFHLGDLLLDIISSSAITILIICAIEQVRISAMRRK
ncbi:MAG: rod shape-determining protein MreD [Bacteroidales bacterium]|nr:rod shape-determining protein MreD [Bacteroidales bacterium]